MARLLFFTTAYLPVGASLSWAYGIYTLVIGAIPILMVVIRRFDVILMQPRKLFKVMVVVGLGGEGEGGERLV